jgi:hypothetical protein
MWKAVMAFLRLSIHPLPGAWNVVGIGLPGVGAASLWALKNPALALIAVLATVAVLFGVAGVRLQKRLSARKADEGFLDSLGRLLTWGRWTLDEIESAADEYLALMSETKAMVDSRARGLSEEERAELDERARVMMDKPNDLDWHRKVRDLLNRRLPHYYSAMFDGLAGLTPADPSPKVKDDAYWRKRWIEHEMRLQRLHQIIERLHSEWRQRWF